MLDATLANSHGIKALAVDACGYELHRKWPDTIEELLDWHLVKKPMAQVDACYGHPSSPIRHHPSIYQPLLPSASPHTLLPLSLVFDLHGAVWLPPLAVVCSQLLHHGENAEVAHRHHKLLLVATHLDRSSYSMFHDSRWPPSRKCLNSPCCLLPLWPMCYLVAIRPCPSKMPCT